ncbi:pEARLI1-like lipid transfer protein 1 [Nymphaea colorata]|nr:pEARLI1-like lipid transfer protein 1 [Nymphaea colorata]
MASSSSSLAVLLLSLNLLFFTLVSANSVPCAPKHKPKPKVTPTPYVPKYPPYIPYPKCPRDALKLAACANLLGGLVNLVVGPGSSHCCGLLEGLADVDAAACLCTVIKANVLGINLNVPLSLSLLLNACGRVPPEGYKCA